MHRDHHLGPELPKGLEGLLRIHVNVALCRRLIGSDGKKGDIDVRTPANFLETIEIGGVTAMKDRSPRILDEKTSKPPVTVVENAGTPVARRRGVTLRHVPKALPLPQLWTLLKPSNEFRCRAAIG
jgi:hypothetical protein